MTSNRGARVALSIAVVAITGLSSGVVSLSSASAASKPKVVVTPSKNLKNNQRVKVTGTGFTPGDTVYVVECLAKAKGQAGCKISGIPTALTITATGVLPRSTFKVTEGTVGNGKCGTTKSNLKGCAVSVGNISGGDSAVAVFAFKTPLKK